MINEKSLNKDSTLLETRFLEWRLDPNSVEPQWQAFFEGYAVGTAQSSGSGYNSSNNGCEEQGSLVSLIYNYRTLGHTQAHTNPLDKKEDIVTNSRLQLAEFGISEEDLTSKEVSSVFFNNGQRMQLGTMIAKLKEVYCGTLGFEFMHINDSEQRHWLRQKIEQRLTDKPATDDDLKAALRDVLQAEMFEQFLGKKFIGEKRFSLEGGEGLIAMLNSLLAQSAENGIKEIEVGMAHRGRLNVLRNFLQKPLLNVFEEFSPYFAAENVEDGTGGDVKYHLGHEVERASGNNQKVRISLAANPSHLEFVNAVTQGRSRARQRIIGDDGVRTDRTQVLPVLIHGDAAFAGQGVVAETLNFSQLEGYRTGGTIHIIINNQIGFTTRPSDARSSVYATDVAKMIDAPIVHVNGEDPSALLWVIKFALQYRQQWGRDIVIDMYCYRRQGHNETDQAAFTVPKQAQKIASRRTFAVSYKQQLVEQGVITEAEAAAIIEQITADFEKEHQIYTEQEAVRKEQFEDYSKFVDAKANVPYQSQLLTAVQTGISEEAFSQVGSALVNIPTEFKLHPTLDKRFLSRRRKALTENKGIDWACAESLAWGSLLLDGYPVRLSGQDCRRGTFSQRHAVLYDYNTRERYFPLRNIADEQAKFCVYNSHLSETAVLGFEYGYSLGCTKMLIMWEAQFGDFANGAQVIIDQFIASSEEKWGANTSLVMLLPHSYEGMGPEHSSARLERFLQLCAKDNMIVVNLTTPAQYFHALRRQKLNTFTKPLVVMSPKSLLTHPKVVSVREEFTTGSTFQEILPDVKEHDVNKVDRLILCSGKVFYDLDQYREEKGITDTVILRVEQLYPLHEELLAELLTGYNYISNVVWCQEEPRNMGAWSHLQPHLENLFNTNILYAGRLSNPSPATGYKYHHKVQQQQLVQQAFQIV